MTRLKLIGLAVACAVSLTGCQTVQSAFGDDEGDDTQRADLAASQMTTIGVNAYLWRAALDTLSFTPLAQTDSNGGVIVTDWYANPQNPSERVKVTVTILDQDLRADALRVTASRQTLQNGQWVDAPVQAATVQQLEEIILTRARDLRRAAVRRISPSIEKVSRDGIALQSAEGRRPLAESLGRGAARSAPRTIATEPKAYVLEMFPYPSGRIHMGHVRNYTMGDVLARYRRMKGFEVLHPMGWDAFGMPAENAAMERKASIRASWTRANIATMQGAAEAARLRARLEPRARHLRPRLLRPRAGAVPRPVSRPAWSIARRATVNWDPVDMTVLANEQVIDGRGWRSGALVERRKLSQWFLKITDFAEDLLDGLGDARRTGPTRSG